MRNPPPARAPSGSRIYAIGDIHGCADLLEIMLDRIAEDAAAAVPAGRLVVVFLGDYIDRGPDSAAVVDRLSGGPAAPLANAEWVVLKGNHEEAMLAFADGTTSGRGWLANGGLATVRAYAGPLPPDAGDDPELLRERLNRSLPARHRDFLAGLKLVHVEGDYLFVHAGLRPGVALADQRPADLMGIREEFIHATQSFGRIVVHGHTVVKQPENRANRIAIDTGAYRSGVLTSVVVEGGERRFLSVGV